MGFISHKVSRLEIKAGDHIYTWKTAFAYSHHGIYLGENKIIHFTDENPKSASCWNLSSCCRSSVSNLSASCYGGKSSQPKITAVKCSSSSSSFSSDQNVPSSCSNPSDCGISLKPKSGVLVSCLDCFIGKGSLYLFQYGVYRISYMTKIRGGTCTTAESHPPEEVIHRAMYLLQNGFGTYDVLKNNCEDFALYCKTGLLVNGKVTAGTGSSSQVSYIVTAFKVVVLSGIGKVVSSSTPLGTVAIPVSVGMHCWDRYKADIGVRKDVEKVDVEDLASFRGGKEEKSEVVNGEK